MQRILTCFFAGAYLPGLFFLLAFAVQPENQIRDAMLQGLGHLAVAAGPYYTALFSGLAGGAMAVIGALKFIARCDRGPALFDWNIVWLFGGGVFLMLATCLGISQVAQTWMTAGGGMQLPSGWQPILLPLQILTTIGSGFGMFYLLVGAPFYFIDGAMDFDTRRRQKLLAGRA